jgi:signal transduction protein with GAF and PtsI domain
MDTQSYDKTIEALTLISRAITSDQYLEEILRLIVLVTAEVMNSKVCSLWLLDEKTQTLAIRATQSINREYLKKRSLKVGEGVVGYVAQHNKSYSCDNVFEDSRFKEKALARKMGLVSLLSVPMSVRDRVIGVINCYTSVAHSFTETEKNLFTTVANQAAVAIFNTELMVQSRVIQEELETRKLVERAKDILIRRRNLSGEEAFRWIQKRSMDSRKSMREVAEAVLLSEEI